MIDKVQKIRAFIERRKETLKPCGGQGFVVTQLMRELCDDFLSFIDSMQLEEIPPKFPLISLNFPKEMIDFQKEKSFKAGAKWKNENLWKPADGDDLPEIDREVIALLDNGKVVFAHRSPEYWDGKDIATGKVARNYPKTYDKGGWNIPDVKWWLDCSMPKEIEL